MAVAVVIILRDAETFCRSWPRDSGESLQAARSMFPYLVTNVLEMFLAQ